MKAKRLLYFILTALFVQKLWAQESTVKTLRIVYNTKIPTLFPSKKQKTYNIWIFKTDTLLFIVLSVSAAKK